MYNFCRKILYKWLNMKFHKMFVEDTLKISSTLLNYENIIFFLMFVIDIKAMKYVLMKHF